jgi:hypothetical protein
MIRRKAATAGSGLGDHAMTNPVITIDDQLSPYRRRRIASLRLGPYGDGPADPLDDLRSALTLADDQDDHSVCCPAYRPPRRDAA